MKAVDGVSFTIRRGETLGLVGESGSRQVDHRARGAAHADADGGTHRVRGRGHPAARQGAELLAVRRRMQMVYQDPYGSLNPRMTIRDIVGEPLAVHGLDGDRGAHAREGRST